MAPTAISNALRLLLTLALLSTVSTAGAQSLTDPIGSADTAKEGAALKADPLGRETPQGLVARLMGALGSGDYDLAQRFFETGSITPLGDQIPVQGSRLARQFHQALNRSGSVITPAELSAEPTGRIDDGLAEDLEGFGTLGRANGTPDPLLARRVERDGKAIWLVSEETLRKAYEVAREAGRQQAFIERFPEGPTLFGAPASHWLALLVALGASFAAAWVITAARGIVVALIKRFRGETMVTRFIDASAAPIRVLITLFIFTIAIRSLGISVVARYHATFLAQIAGLLGFTWLMWRIADAAGDFILGQMTRRGRLTAYSAVSFLRRAFKAILGLFLIAALLRAFGVDITTGLAALGIGGLAIALGAQKLFENLIGSLTVIADRPVRIGDFCRFGDQLGTVEDIGIRSTRIRTLSRTVVTVPNGEFASLHIENYSQRDMFWFNPTLNLRYETSPDQIRYLLQEIRRMLYSHPKVDPEAARARFTTLGSHSLDIEVFAYVRAADFAESLEVQEDLLLRCMDIVEASGTGFAFPSQTLYLGRDGGLDAEKSKAAEASVEGWRQSGDLQVPRFRPETIRELRGKIDYPPEGAAIRKGGG